jgi:hypothetical protein
VPAQAIGAEEAEQITKAFVAKKFNLQDAEVLTVAFSATYGTFTVSVTGKAKYRHRVSTTAQEEAQHHSPEEASESDKSPKGVRPTLPTAFSYDVTVDKTGTVVAWSRVVRTSREAEAIAREYALGRHELTHFRPYATTFDGTYFTVYGGGLVYEGGIVRSALKIYKSNFYDVKVDRTGIVVGWTTEGLITHYSTKLQRLR